MNSRTRRHGCQSPLDPHQVTAVLVFCVLVTGCYVFYFPLVSSEASKYTLLSIYSIIVLSLFALYFWTSCSDPSDPGLRGEQEGEFFCTLCQAHVGSGSKHCRACERCVNGFDHHCKWLNNCVGQRNYKPFFGLVLGTVSLLTVQLIWGLWLFATSFSDSDSSEALLEQTYGVNVNFNGWRVALALYIAITLVSVVMLGELLIFHVVLIKKGMTTYDYIIAQREERQASASSSSLENNKSKMCRSSRVADESVVAPQRKKIHINPCAAMRTKKVKNKSDSVNEEFVKRDKSSESPPLMKDITYEAIANVSVKGVEMEAPADAEIKLTQSPRDAATLKEDCIE